MHADAAHRVPQDDQGLGRAVALAIGLHLLLLLCFYLAPYLTWERDTPAAAGLPVMDASLEASSAEIRAARSALQHVPEPVAEPVVEPSPPPPEPLPEREQDTVPPPQPLPEPRPQEAQVTPQQQAQERIPVPDTEDQDAARREAESAEKARQEQEEKRRQEQIDLTERERQKEVEEKQRKAAQQQAEREKKLAQIRAERARLQRQSNLAEQRLKQLADASTAATPEPAAASPGPPAPTEGARAGNNGADLNDLRGRYAAAIQAAVKARWTRPDNVPNLPCVIVITQLPGGEVIDAKVEPSCPYDDAGKRSVEAAVLKAQPLPYAGFEPVFDRRLRLTFRPGN